MQTDIIEQIRNFVVNNFLFGDGKGLEDTDLFLEQGIIDSTGVLELVAFLEETFGFKVEDEEIVPDNLNSVALVTEYIMQKLQVSEDK